MTRFIAIACASLLFTGIAHSQDLTTASHNTPAMTSTPTEADCESKIGSHAANAAEEVSIKKCEADAMKAAKYSTCESRAVSADGKPLAGAAKDESVEKCMAAS